jgi:hypothetical protein
MKQVMKNILLAGPVAGRIYRRWIKHQKPFQDSESYWNDRYEAGGNSGDGSYNQCARFKAEILNTFVLENGIRSVIEYGSGDGNQLSLAQYPQYIGFDVSPNAIARCVKRFSNDASKTFKLLAAYGGETAELTLSLDVIFHLVEETVFAVYMNLLFDSSEKFVVIYSSDSDENPEGTAAHVRHRKFSEWIKDNKTNWKLLKQIPNRYPFNAESNSGSFADFYIYSKTG